MKKVLALAAILALSSSVAMAEPTTKGSTEKPNVADASTAPATTTPATEKPAMEQGAKTANNAANAPAGKHAPRKHVKKESTPHN